MTDWTDLTRNLEQRDFTVRTFATKEEAADYLDSQIDGVSVAFGGSVTVQEMGLYPRLAAHNNAFWHWDPSVPADESRARAAQTEVYISSVNGLAETGELINIDGTGNRVSASMSAKERVYFIAGVNKIAEDYDKALWRARNVASPRNARRIGTKTPCVLKELKCYDCKSPERICRGLTVLWRKLNGVKECVVVIVGEELGY